jgi:hypothetical protein
MPNITKYMGKAIPGMNVIKGAWDAGQGVDSLVKALQRLAAKQSGGPVPMEDIEEWMSKNPALPMSIVKDPGDRDYREIRGGVNRARYLGAEAKDPRDDLRRLVSQNKKWDTDVKFLVQALQELQNIKEESKGKRRGSKYGHYNVGGGKRYFEDLIWDEQGKIDTILEAYTGGERRHTGTADIEPGSRGTTPNVSKARDSIWMSVLDAMKKREKKK